MDLDKPFFDPFKVLGVTKHASNEKVKRFWIFHRACLKYLTTADACPKEQEIHDLKEARINRAHEILQNPKLRRFFIKDVPLKEAWKQMIKYECEWEYYTKVLQSIRTKKASKMNAIK